MRDKVHIVTTEYTLCVDPDEKIIEQAIENEVDDDLLEMDENNDIGILV